MSFEESLLPLAKEHGFLEQNQDVSLSRETVAARSNSDPSPGPLYLPQCNKASKCKAYKFTIPSSGEVIIVRPGNFVLCKSVKLDPSATVAIRVESDDVNIDLSGYIIAGQGEAQTVRQTGIIVKGGVKNVSIRNGRITGVTVGLQLGAAVATITRATSGVNPTVFTANNTFVVGDIISITGANPSAYNLTNVKVIAASSTKFSVGVQVDGPYGSGGIAEIDTQNVEIKDLEISDCFGFVLNSNTNEFVGIKLGKLDGVTIKNVNISNNKSKPTTGLAIAYGLSAETAPVDNLLVEDSHFDKNFGTFANGARLSYSTGSKPNVVFKNHTWRRCTFNGNSDLDYPSAFGIGSGISFGIGLSYEKGRNDYAFAENITMVDCEAVGNLSKALSIGIEFNYTNNFVLENCNMSNNINSGDEYAFNGGEMPGYAYGFKPKSSRNGLIINCVANSNISKGGAIRINNGPANPAIPVRSMGFYYPRCENITTQNCVANGNLVDRPAVIDALGLGFIGIMQESPSQATNINCTNLLFQNCSALGNNAGFGFSNSNIVTLQNCVANNNTKNGLVLRLLGEKFPATPIQKQATDVTVEDCTFIRNGEYGILDESATTISSNLQTYIRNQAQKNGVNYSGLPAGTPIRSWVLGNLPDAEVAGAQLDNLDITA